MDHSWNISWISSMLSVLFILAFLLSGLFMGRKVKNAKEFDKGGQKAGAFLVAGNIIGTLVGGSSTVGTAQLAFHSGLSALWFTLGSALGCILLAIFLVKPLRNSDCRTIVGLINREYGSRTGTVAGLLSAFGLMINLIAQILAANALLTTLFGLDAVWCAVISAIMMFLYVFGGVKGTGYLGVAKTILLYVAVLASAAVCLYFSGGLSVFGEQLPRAQYFNLLSRGAGIDLGAGLSVALGVISTQTYIQAILSAKSDRSARTGALLSAALIPLVGIGSLFIGYFMRIQTPDLNPAKAFPQFIITYMPPIVSQLMLVVLLITVIGTGAGIALGLSTTVTNDLCKKIFPETTSDKALLYVSRGVIFITLTLAVLITHSNLSSTILTWGFMSMGLRAVVLLFPMLFSLFAPGKTRPIAAILSSVTGLAAMMIVFLTPMKQHIDPLIIGMLMVIITYCAAPRPSKP